MLRHLTRTGFVLALLVHGVQAQEGQETPEQPATPAAEEGAGTEDKQAAAAGGLDGPVEITEDALDEEEVKVLKPRDVPNELVRLKSKADIKAEVTVLPLHGRSVTVKGIIRNGKLIERFVGRAFESQKDIDHPQAGVRLWWVEGSAGWIFLRYAQIQSIALTGKLTPEERRKILEALRARREPEKEKPQEVDPGEALDKLSPGERESYLLSHYPAEDGWNHKRLRDLKRKQIIEEKTLNPEEAIFVKYFPELIKARLKELQQRDDKTRIEPGTREDDGEPEPGSGLPGAGQDD